MVTQCLSLVKMGWQVFYFTMDDHLQKTLPRERKKPQGAFPGEGTHKENIKDLTSHRYRKKIRKDRPLIWHRIFLLLTPFEFDQKIKI